MHSDHERVRNVDASMLCMHYRGVAPTITVHERVRLWREFKGWSQAELADEVDMAQSKISRIENGETEPRAIEIEAIASAFDLTMVQFYGAIPRRTTDKGREAHAS